jgi:farnesyl diphosphate synthase
LSRLEESLRDAADAVNRALINLLPNSDDAIGRLTDAMRYSTMAGGKRLRPFFVLSGADLFDVPRTWSMPTAAAIEMVHTYSLVHDDLPAMDDDDLRRGRPTCHVKFDDATAILAGDSLLTLAFQVIAAPDGHPDPAVRADLGHALALAAGALGMAGGQAMDLAAEHQSFDLDAVIRLQHLKTGALFGFSCEAGAIMARADDAARRALRCYAANIGLEWISARRSARTRPRERRPSWGCWAPRRPGGAPTSWSAKRLPSWRCSATRRRSYARRRTTSSIAETDPGRAPTAT